MTVQDLGAIGELIGALATVATLLYLAIQIRNNTQWNKGQALESTIDRVVSWGRSLNENPEMHVIYLKGKTEFHTFDELQRHGYHLMLLELFAAMEALHEHSKTRAVKAEATANARRRIRYELGGSGALMWWKEVGRSAFSTDFAEYVDEILADNSA